MSSKKYSEIVFDLSTKNKYSKWYSVLIENALQRINLNLTKTEIRKHAKTNLGYCEGHHILPKCFCSRTQDLDKNNIVYLTAREHFVAHLLLTKMFLGTDKNKMQFALNMMTKNNKHHKRKISSVMYEYIKQCNSEASKERFKTTPYPKNRKKTKGHSQETKEKLSLSHKGRVYYHNLEGVVIHINANEVVPEGFLKGNPNAATMTGKKYKTYYNPVLKKSLRVFEGDLVPDGFIEGEGKIWIQKDGISKRILEVLPIPEGWQLGRAKVKSKTRHIITPFGEFESISSFTKEYNAPALLFYGLDAKFKKETLSFLFLDSLMKINVDFSKTKREIGFDYV